MKWWLHESTTSPNAMQPVSVHLGIEHCFVSTNILSEVQCSVHVDHSGDCIDVTSALSDICKQVCIAESDAKV